MDEFKCQKCNYTFYDIEIDECPHCGFPIQLLIDREMTLDVQGTLSSSCGGDLVEYRFQQQAHQALSLL